MNPANTFDEDASLDLQGISKVMNRILSKLSFEDFLVLSQTSKVLKQICEKSSVKFNLLSALYLNKRFLKVDQRSNLREVKFRSIFAVMQSPITFNFDCVSIGTGVTSSRLRNVVKFLESHNATASLLYIWRGNVRFSPEDLDILLKTLRIKTLWCSVFLSREFFTYPHIQKMPELILYNASMTDDEFLKMEAHTFEMKNARITEKALNQFLLQWKKGERALTRWAFDFDVSGRSRNYEQILEGVDASLIWSRESHDHSIIGALPYESLEYLRWHGNWHFYSLARSDNIADFKILELSEKHFSVRSNHDETSTLFHHLSRDEKFLVTGTREHDE